MPCGNLFSVFLCLGLQSYIVNCMRVKPHAQMSQTRVGSVLGFNAGDLFDNRFQLQELMSAGLSELATEPNSSVSSLLQNSGPIPLPNSILTKYGQPPDYLGKGSFGETWKAYDTHMQANVAVKMLYTGNRHVSWARDGGNRRMAVELEKASHECNLAQMMQSDAQKDPKGASRLMRCLEDHVGSEPRDSYNPLYLVLEFCGNRDLEAFIKDRFKQDSLTMTELQSLWEQLQEGLNYMTNDAHARRWVHHDLKAANIVIDDSQGHETPLLKIIDFGSVTQTPPHALDKPGQIGGGRAPLVATPVYAPYELSEPKVGGRYCYPWYSFDAYSAASTFVEMLSTHTWTELLTWQCYMTTFDSNQKKGFSHPLKKAIESCQNRMHSILYAAQPQVDDIDPEAEADYWGKAAIQQLRRLIKVSAVIQANYNRRVADGRPEDARNKYYEDMHWAMSASEEDLEIELARMLPNRRALIKEIFDDYRSNETSQQFDPNPMRTFALSMVYSLSPYASERTLPLAWFQNDRGIRLSMDFTTPKDLHFKAKVVPCESVVASTCVVPAYLGGTACPEHSTCIQTDEGSVFGALSKKCICDTGYCVVNGECVVADPPVLFEKHDGANAVYESGEFPKYTLGSVQECEQVAAESEAYLYTYFSSENADEALRGLCVLWNYDTAAAQSRLYVSSFDRSGKKLAEGGVLTGVNVELYVPETRMVTQENSAVNVAGELHAMQNGFRGPPKHHGLYRVRTLANQKVVGYRQMK